MLAQDHSPRQVPEPGTTTATTAEACRYCGIIDAPLLSPGVGPHACQVSCQHCGRHWRWVSLLAPAERRARRTKARLAAMRQHPPAEAQLGYLRKLGDNATAPATMAEASERIDSLRRKTEAR